MGKDFWGEEMPFWKEHIYYPLFRLWHRIEAIPRETKWFFQRGFRGYDDSDCWGINSWFTRVVPPMLRQMAKYNSGCPEEFASNEPEFNCDKWRDKINQIADGLSAWEQIESYKFDNEEWKALDKKRNLRVTSYPIENSNCRGMNFHDDFTPEESERYDALTKHCQKEAMNKWHKAMDEFQKYFGNMWD